MNTAKEELLTWVPEEEIYVPAAKMGELQERMRFRQNTRNLVASLAAVALTGIFGLLVTRAETSSIGTAGVGVWSLCGTMLSIVLLPAESITTIGTRDVTAAAGAGDIRRATAAYNSLAELRRKLGGICIGAAAAAGVLGTLVRQAGVLQTAGSAFAGRGINRTTSGIQEDFLEKLRNAAWHPAGKDLARGTFQAPGYSGEWIFAAILMVFLLAGALIRLRAPVYESGLAAGNRRDVLAAIETAMAGFKTVLILCFLHGWKTWSKMREAADGVNDTINTLAFAGDETGRSLEAERALSLAAAFAGIGAICLMTDAATVLLRRKAASACGCRLVRTGDAAFHTREEQKHLVQEGSWSMLCSLSVLLLSGLDLVIGDVFLGTTAMGILAISKMIPAMLERIAGGTVSAYLPSLTAAWGDGADAGDTKTNAGAGNIQRCSKPYGKRTDSGPQAQIRELLRRAMASSAILIHLILVEILVFGEAFYHLWLPREDARLLTLLTIAATIGFVPMSGLQILYGVFTMTDHVKENARAIFVSSVVSIALTLAAVTILARGGTTAPALLGLLGIGNGIVPDLRTKLRLRALISPLTGLRTSFGLLAIAGISSAVNLVRNLTFTIPKAADYLHCSRGYFYQTAAWSVLSVGVRAAAGLLWCRILPPDNAAAFLIDSILLGLAGLLLDLKLAERAENV